MLAWKTFFGAASIIALLASALGSPDGLFPTSAEQALLGAELVRWLQKHLVLDAVALSPKSRLLKAEKIAERQV